MNSSTHSNAFAIGAGEKCWEHFARLLEFFKKIQEVDSFCKKHFARLT